MFDIVVNPVAGKGKTLTSLEKTENILKSKGLEYRVHKTERVGHATEIVRELTKDGADLIILGGDGTFNEVLNGIVDFDKTTVGFVPCGSGNDFVRCTDIPTDTDAAVERILKGKVGFMDFIDLGKKRCLNVAGGGMDTDTLVTYYRRKIKGKFGYYTALLHVLIKLKFHKVLISIDGGEPAEKTVFMIGIANGKFIGGGLPISPNSVVDDGKLNVVIINELKRRQVLPALMKFMKGKHIGQPFTEEYLCDSAKLEMLDECKVQADGEISDEKVLDCKIIHETLKVYCE